MTREAGAGRRRSTVLGVVGVVVALVAAVLVWPGRGPGPGPAASPSSAFSPDLPRSREVGGTIVGLVGVVAVHMLVSGGPASRQLTLGAQTLGPGDGCHPGEVAAVTREDSTVVEVAVGSYAPAETGSTLGPGACPAYATTPHRQVLELAAPLGARTVLDGSTGRAVLVLDASTTPYPTQTLVDPYVLTGVEPGPVVTWSRKEYSPEVNEWRPGPVVTLRPASPPPADEAALGSLDLGGRSVTVSGRTGTVTARWREDPTHSWMLTVAGGGADYVRDGVVVDYGGLPELVSTFRPAG